MNFYERAKQKHPPASRMDKLCGLALAGVLVGTSLVSDALDSRAEQAWEQSHRPATEARTDTPTIDIDISALVEATKAAQDPRYKMDVPLSPTLQKVLWEACEAHGVPVCLALGVMEIESDFHPDAYNGVSRGLMQLNDRYFPADLTPAENIQAGVAYLGELLERYQGDEQAALRAYNLGHDDGGRVYARAVLNASEKWGNG